MHSSHHQSGENNQYLSIQDDNFAGPRILTVHDEGEILNSPQAQRKPESRHMDIILLSNDKSASSAAPTSRLEQYEAELVRKSKEAGGAAVSQREPGADGKDWKTIGTSLADNIHNLGRKRNQKYVQIMKNMNAAPPVTAQNLIKKSELQRDNSFGNDLEQDSDVQSRGRFRNQNVYISPFDNRKNQYISEKRTNSRNEDKEMPSPTIKDLHRHQGSSQKASGKDDRPVDYFGNIGIAGKQSENSPNLRAGASLKKRPPFQDLGGGSYEEQQNRKKEILQSIANLSEILPADDESDMQGPATFRQL